jgi:bifunctional DNA-binding transcriptional regulator/antitoxin component of YhaV-PrlF toxin-antitoxin module
VSPWRWSGADPEPSGRLTLPTLARRLLVDDAGGAVEVSGVVRGDTLVLRPDLDAGRAMTVDGRGRLYLPVWLRRHAGFLVGTNHDADVVSVVVVPAVLFDAIGDRLLERVR